MLLNRIPICVLWVIDEFLTRIIILSQVASTVIKSIGMCLYGSIRHTTLSTLCSHLHPEIHEKHIIGMAILKLPLLLFPSYGRFDWKRVFKWRNVCILKICWLCHVNIFVSWHPWVLNLVTTCWSWEAWLAICCTNSLLLVLTEGSLKPSVKDTYVLWMFDTILFKNIGMHRIYIIYCFLIDFKVIII